MRTKVKRTSPEKALMRVLDAMAGEAIESSDEEVLEAATDLRMDPTRRDSAAYAGLTFFARPQLSDFFDIEVPQRLSAPVKPTAAAPTTKPLTRRRGAKRFSIPTDKKPPSGQ